MRRKDGQGLVRNERKVLAASLRLAVSGEHQLHGYELFARLREWEGGRPMDHGTLYRCLRALEQRGYFTSELARSHPGERIRVEYCLTPEGVSAARESALRLAAEAEPPTWVDAGLATRALGPVTSS